jgi:hypothetical protein
MADVIKLANDVVAACARGDFAAALAVADEKFVAALPEPMLAETWRQVQNRAGMFVSVTGRREYRHLLGPVKVIFLQCDFQQRKLEIEVSFRADKDQLVGLAFLTPGLEG